MDDANGRTLNELFHNYNYDYARGMKIVCVSSTVNPKGSTYATAEQNIDDMKFLEDGYCMVILDDCHRCCTVVMLGDKKGV